MVISNAQAYELSDTNSRYTIYEYNTALNQIMRRCLITKRTQTELLNVSYMLKNIVNYNTFDENKFPCLTDEKEY